MGRANLRSRPIESTVVDYQGNIITGADVVIKRNTPQGSVVADTQKSDETGYFKTIPLPNGKYDLFYQNRYTGSILHFHDISIPCYTPTNDNYKPKPPFEVLKEQEKLSDYAFFLQIENVDVASDGNSYPIYNFDPIEFDGHLAHLADFFSLDSVSRLTLTRFDIEFYIPITSENKTTRTSRFQAVPGIRFFSESQIVVPIDYHSLVLKHPMYKFEYETATVSASTPTNSKMVINCAGDALLNVAKVTNIGDVYQVSNVGNGPTYFYIGIVTNISADGKTITLERLTTRNGASSIPDNTEVDKIQVWHGLRSIANSSPFDNFTVFENLQFQDFGYESYSYPSF